MKRFWVSWYGDVVPFTWNGPWWISGYALVDAERGIPTICAAVVAEDAEHAKRLIVESHDEPVELEWRFANERAADWEPFGDRFGRRDWMVWPCAPCATGALK